MLDKVINIIAEQFNKDAEEIKLEMNLTDDLKADSLEIFDLVMTLEEEFGIEIADEDIDKFKTVKDIVDYINSL